MTRSLRNRLVLGAVAAAAVAAAVPAASAAGYPSTSKCASVEVGVVVAQGGVVCHYTATVNAGFLAVGSYDIAITRGSAHYHYHAVNKPKSCGKVGLIRKGDKVAVTVPKYWTGVVGVGKNFHC